MHSQLSPRTVKDKANHAVILDKTTSDKLYKDVQSYRLITVATLVDRLKINGSLARQALKDLEDKGQIKKVVGHSKLSIYSKCFLSFSFFAEMVGDKELGGELVVQSRESEWHGELPSPTLRDCFTKSQSSNG